MRFSLLLSLFLLFPFSLMAETPIPAEKPKQASFQDIINNAIDTIKKPISEIEILKSSIITPAPTPAKKMPKIIKVTSNKYGVPIPTNKPLYIYTSKVKKHVLKQPINKSVVIEYRGNSDNNRMGGSKHQTERNYASRRTKLRETTEKSPFKTTKLPRADKLLSSDPIILFFKEKSSEVEVGQISVLKNDVLKRMKQYKNKKAVIYGYAQRNRKSPDKMQSLSLSRALMVSDYLNSNRIDESRLSIRAMGNDTPISPKNRVDIVLYD